MKKIISLLLCAIMIMLCFSGCSGNAEMTEANITRTVTQAEKALKTFDQKKLEKYVDSTTLSTIIKYVGKYDFINEVGESIFENLSMEIISIDAENGTVTLSVTNKDLRQPAADFASRIKSENSTIGLLSKLNNQVFVDANVSAINDMVENAEMAQPVEITVKILQGKKNLALSFDEAGEDAVSGGALSSIQQIYS